MDIVSVLLFAGAVGLAVKLWSVLGRRTGHEPPRDATAAATGSRESASESEATAASGRLGVSAAMRLSGSLRGGFDEARFLEGARAVYEAIVEGYYTGDAGAWEGLATSEVAKGLELGSREQVEAGAAGSGGMRVEVLEARLEAGEVAVAGGMRRARAGILFVSERTPLGEGGAATRRARDFWTFEKDADDEDPNWVLAATESREEGLYGPRERPEGTA